MQETNLYTATVPPLIQALTNLSAILDKAAAHAEAKKGKMEHLLNDRLVFDQFPLIKQIQVACDVAKGTAARLVGIEIPKYEDTEKTPEELKARIEKTVAFLKTVRPEDLIGHEGRKIDIYYMPGKHLNAYEYAFNQAMPNFYFHVTTAYSILRKNGVGLGKGDYIGALQYRDS